MMKAVCTSETSIYFETKRRYIAKAVILILVYFEMPVAQITTQR
jgi:hypothetical protein